MGRTRKRAKERAAERKKRRQRNTLIAVAAVAVLVVVGVILTSRPVAVEVGEELLTRYAGVPTSTTDRGFPILGNPEAPARLLDYSSFGCPSCARFSEDVTENIVDRVRAGELSFTYVPVLLPQEDDRAARAALCAGEQGFFWEYHDLLFGWQQQFQATAFQNSRLEAGAEALGMDVDEFNTCRRSDRPEETLENAQASFSTSGGSGTPTVIINNELVTPTLVAVNSTIDAIMETAQPVPVIVEDEPAAPETDAATEDASDAGEEPAADEEETESAVEPEPEDDEDAETDEAEAAEATEEAE